MFRIVCGIANIVGGLIIVGMMLSLPSVDEAWIALFCIGMMSFMTGLSCFGENPDA